MERDTNTKKREEERTTDVVIMIYFRGLPFFLAKLKMLTNIEVVSIHQTFAMRMNSFNDILAIYYSSLRITHLNKNFIRLNEIF